MANKRWGLYSNVKKLNTFDSSAKEKREGLSALDKPLDGDRFETREMGPTKILFTRAPQRFQISSGPLVPNLYLFRVSLGIIT